MEIKSHIFARTKYPSSSADNASFRKGTAVLGGSAGELRAFNPLLDCPGP